jgi:hypothetical protein
MAETVLHERVERKRQRSDEVLALAEKIQPSAASQRIKFAHYASAIARENVFAILRESTVIPKETCT